MGSNRKFAYGEQRDLSLTDNLGSWLSKRKLLRFARARRPACVVDIGCGYDAELLRAIAPYAENCIGIDIHVKQQHRGIQLIETLIVDRLPMLESGTTDFIIMNNVLEHMEYPLEILKETHRALKNGGTLFVNVPSWPGKRLLEFSAFHAGFSAVVEIDDHKMYYNPRDLWPLMVKAGYRPRHLRIGFHKVWLNTFAWAVKGAAWDGSN